MRKFWTSGKSKDEVRPAALIKVIKNEPEDTVFEKPKRKARNPHHKKLPKGIVWGIAGLTAFFVIGLVISFYVAKRQVAESVAKDASVLQSGVNDLQNLDPQSAAQKFASLKNISPSDLGPFFEAFGSLFSSGRDAVSSFAGIAGELSDFSDELNGLSESIPRLFSTGDGSALLSGLQKLRSTIGALGDSGGKLAGLAALAEKASPESGAQMNLGSYLPLIAQLQGSKTFLDAFIPWFGNPKPHHILVLMQNPSEIRPAGGFLGSYADITIASGSVTGIGIHDIADVDAAFTKKIVPPKPLQLLLTHWRPADANWFFDFPASASKTAEFFEESGLYSGSDASGSAASSASSTAPAAFDAVVAVSPKVISDLLTITGPITVTSGSGRSAASTTFTADNFLVQTQKIVQAGQATSATYPKQILRDLAAAVLSKLNSSEGSSMNSGSLMQIALNWFNEKDIMVYFKNPTIENFVESYGAGGDVYQLPQKFNGDYFALVDANVDGGKQDTYVSSSVSYVGQIGADGTFTAHVTVDRKHNGNKSDYWWYKEPDVDYMQMFVPDGSVIENISGGSIKKVVPRINYAANKYENDPLVQSIESTEQSLFAYPGIAWHEESGKTVFTTWITLKSGSSAELALYYTHKLFTPPADGVQYEFMFEKQAGVSRHYDVEIDAPLGYVFVENNIASFMYHTDDLPGRIEFTLTLKKLQ